MVRKRAPATVIGPDWFLVEWMKSKEMKQADLMRRTGWTKATTNDIVHGRTNYYRQILNEAASALQIQPWELLMPPEDANALRAMHEGGIKLAAETRNVWRGPPADEQKRDGTDG